MPGLTDEGIASRHGFVQFLEPLLSLLPRGHRGVLPVLGVLVDRLFEDEFGLVQGEPMFPVCCAEFEIP